MHIKRMLCFMLAITLYAAGCSEYENNNAGATTTAINALSDIEKAAGWQLLFDGESFEGWRGLGREGVPEGHWVIEDGCIKKVESGEVPVQADGQPLKGGDLMTLNTFGNYEFSFEWKVSEGANSGIKYNVSEAMSTANGPGHAALGFEYQVLDDDKHADAEDPTHRAAALYDLIDVPVKSLKPVGEFNHGRIVFNGSHGEHWLNGEKVLEFDLDSEDFSKRYQESKYAPVAGFPDRREGHIVLQDHSDTVWFRNLKIRML